jgi:hypothetical protein
VVARAFGYVVARNGRHLNRAEQVGRQRGCQRTGIDCQLIAHCQHAGTLALAMLAKAVQQVNL